MLQHGQQIDAVALQLPPIIRGVEPIAGKAVELVNDHIIDALHGGRIDHRLKRRAAVRGRAFRAVANLLNDQNVFALAIFTDRTELRVDAFLALTFGRKAGIDKSGFHILKTTFQICKSIKKVKLISKTQVIFCIFATKLQF